MRPESEPYDGLLIHSYLMRQRGKGPLIPSARSHLALREAAKLYDQGVVRNFAITAGSVWGEKFPSWNQVLAERLVNTYHVPTEAIHFPKEGALLTETEIQGFLGLAEEKGWQNLADLAFKTHHRWTIPRLYERKGWKEGERKLLELPERALALRTYYKQDHGLQLLSVEDVAWILKDRQAMKMADLIGHSRYEWTFWGYELFKLGWMLLDPDSKNMRRKASAHRCEKARHLPWPLSKTSLDIDKYYL